MMHPRIAGTIIGVILGGLISVIMLYTYLLFFDYRVPPIKLYYSHPTIVERDALARNEIKEIPFIKPGDVFYVFRDFCVTAKFDGIESRRVLVSKFNPQNQVPLPIIESRLDGQIGCEHKTFSNTLPKETAPGEYWLETDSQYKLGGNPVGKYTFHWPVVSVAVH